MKHFKIFSITLKFKLNLNFRLNLMYIVENVKYRQRDFDEQQILNDVCQVCEMNARYIVFSYSYKMRLQSCFLKNNCKNINNIII